MRHAEAESSTARAVVEVDHMKATTLFASRTPVAAVPAGVKRALHEKSRSPSILETVMSMPEFADAAKLTARMSERVRMVKFI